jgi:TonB family protein
MLKFWTLPPGRATSTVIDGTMLQKHHPPSDRTMRRARMLVILSMLGGLISMLAARLPDADAQVPGVPAPSGATQAASEELAPLFTERDLASHAVSIEGGVLAITEDAGWLGTDRTRFGNFTLRLEVQAPPAATRVLLMIFGEVASQGRAAQGYALPLLGAAAPTRDPIDGVRVTASPAAASVANLLRPGADWQAYEIVRRDEFLSVTLNDNVVVSRRVPAMLDGSIAIHVEGAPARVRNVVVRSEPVSPGSLTAGGVYRLGGDITAPVAVLVPNPKYTPQAIAARIEGVVRLECVVLPTGACADIQVVRSLDPTLGLDQEAIRSVSQWRFKPGLRLGQQVPVGITIEVAFALRK